MNVTESQFNNTIIELNNKLKDCELNNVIAISCLIKEIKFQKGGLVDFVNKNENNSVYLRQYTDLTQKLMCLENLHLFLLDFIAKSCSFDTALIESKIQLSLEDESVKAESHENPIEKKEPNEEEKPYNFISKAKAKFNLAQTKLKEMPGIRHVKNALLDPIDRALDEKEKKKNTIKFTFYTRANELRRKIFELKPLPKKSLLMTATGRQTQWIQFDAMLRDFRVHFDSLDNLETINEGLAHFNIRKPISSLFNENDSKNEFSARFADLKNLIDCFSQLITSGKNWSRAETEYLNNFSDLDSLEKLIKERQISEYSDNFSDLDPFEELTKKRQIKDNIVRAITKDDLLPALVPIIDEGNPIKPPSVSQQRSDFREYKIK